ncbi:MAG TPA: sigma-54 dependent transcriptional regulator, partial [bacterium]
NMAPYKILIVDDEEIMRSSLTDWLKEDGYHVQAVDNGYKALDAVKQEEWDLALVDLKMPGLDGIDVLRKLSEMTPKLPVIIITAYATVDSAVTAIKEGAVDYVVKPFNPGEISLLIAKVLEHQRVVKENVMLRKELTRRFRFQDLIGKSDKMLKVFEIVTTVAPSKSTVLIRGESGTGKELIARAIHELSPRRASPFIAAACGAMAESLLEAELFGYEKGAFTGSIAQHKGRIEQANNGTLFLDEIGDISLKTQVDLLRVLQEREFTRLGGSASIKADVRVIAATNKNLEQMIAKGEFRDDLYYRLNVITIELPPLRDRREDIPLLLDYFLEKIKLETGKPMDKISEEAKKILIEYHWPGNVRQLQNALEHAAVVAKGAVIESAHLPAFLQQKAADGAAANQSLQDVEKEHIINVLNAHNWNVKKAAEVLGINNITLYRKIKQYELKRP